MIEGVTKLFIDGGFVMYPLLLCSFVGMTVVIERTIFHVKRKAGRDPELMMRILEMVRTGKGAEAEKSSAHSKDELIKALDQSLKSSKTEARGVFEMTYSEEDRRLSRYMVVLDTIITLSPLLGILGTVLGIIESFEILGVEGARDPMAVTGGIAKALVTTASGLSIAILMLIPFNIFRSMNESALNEIEEVGTFLETYSSRRQTEKGK